MSSWFVPPRPSGQGALRLFCLPFAGGGASAFALWRRHLPEAIEVWGVQPPGREHRVKEAPHTEWPALIADLTAAIAPHLDRPFAFYGHSLGATLAFELTRSLRREGLPAPRALMVGAARAPQLPRERPDYMAMSRAELVALLRRYEGTPEELLDHAEFLDLLLPVIRADFTLHASYRHEPEPPLDLPLWVFGGEGDRGVGPEDLEAWRALTTEDCRVIRLPGGHFFLREDRQALLQAIAGALAPAIARP